MTSLKLSSAFETKVTEVTRFENALELVALQNLGYRTMFTAWTYLKFDEVMSWQLTVMFTEVV